MGRFLKIGHFLKMGHFFENGAFFWKLGKFWKWGIFFKKMGQILKMGQKSKIWSARHMRVKYALSARESCAGIRASFRNDARASNARGYAWFSGGRFMRHFVLSNTNAKPSYKRKSSMIGTWVNLYFFTESFLLQKVCLFKYFADGWHIFQETSCVYPSLVRCYLQWPPGSAPPTFLRRRRPSD